MTPAGARPILHLAFPVLRAVMKTIGMRPAESGGAIGVSENSGTVTRFQFDTGGQRTAVTYTPDHVFLNRLFKRDWNPRGIRLAGFIHSHPPGMTCPSEEDRRYAERILKGIDEMAMLWLPIVSTVPDTGRFAMTIWGVVRTTRGAAVVPGSARVLGIPDEVELAGFSADDVLGLRSENSRRAADQPAVHCIEIRAESSPSSILVPALPASSLPEAEARDEPVVAQDLERDPSAAVPSPAEPCVEVVSSAPESGGTGGTDEATFERVRDAYDLEAMRSSRLIVVGLGGAAEFVEQCARAGLGQFVLIDPDTVAESNLATQQVYRRDLGRPKVDCVAERIGDIYGSARIVALHKSLDDLCDCEVGRLAFGPIEDARPGRTVLCGFTDSFSAQARVNLLALNLGLPSLCAQVYREGRGAEVTFTYPGITPACHRCILSPRYRHFVDEQRENDVTSDGTPIFATARLNAIKGFVLLAMLHHGTGHPRWGGQLQRIGKRNLVQIRMDPDLGDSLGLGVFDRVFQAADRGRLFYDEAVWLPQDPEGPGTGKPPCPDCGGTGDLRDSFGRIYDTRSGSRIVEAQV